MIYLGQKVPETELRIDVITTGVNCPIHMKIIHLPTGKVYEGEGKSKMMLRRRLIIQLEVDLGYYTPNGSGA